MGRQTDTDVDRRRRQVAASYRRQGYRVTTQSAPDAVPPFLSGCHPDLIAEKAGDHVVIEVKLAASLKGTNDLVKLAERIAAEPGWRLELVALESQDNDSLILAPDWLERKLQPIASATDDILISSYLIEVLAYLLRGLALRNKLRMRDKSPSRVANELAFAGVIDETVLTHIKDVLAWRDDLMHGLSTTRTPVDQATEIKQLCRDLHAHMLNSED
jgi:hypothetical protein